MLKCATITITEYRINMASKYKMHRELNKAQKTTISRHGRFCR